MYAFLSVHIAVLRYYQPNFWNLTFESALAVSESCKKNFRVLNYLSAEISFQELYGVEKFELGSGLRLYLYFLVVGFVVHIFFC